MVSCLPFTLAFDSAPIPPPPFPVGRGEPRLFHARGFAPCIPGAGWDAALGLLVESGLRRGSLPSLSPADAAFSLLCCPPSPKGKDIPPTRARRALFPGGEGGDQGYFMQGASPLASPALGGARHLQTLPCRCSGADLARHWLNLRSRHPAGACPRRCRLPLSCRCPAAEPGRH